MIQDYGWSVLIIIMIQSNHQNQCCNEKPVFCITYKHIDTVWLVCFDCSKLEFFAQNIQQSKEISKWESAGTTSAVVCHEWPTTLVAESTVMGSSFARLVTDSWKLTGIDAHAANQVSEQSPTAANGEAIMSNMNSRDRKAVYNYLARTHGEMCNLCKIDGNSKTLVVDHIDNNNSNNHPENVQLLCRRCNYKKNPRISEREPLDNCESVCPPIHYISFIHHENEIERSKKKEPLFRKYVIEKIESNRVGGWGSNQFRGRKDRNIHYYCWEIPKENVFQWVDVQLWTGQRLTMSGKNNERVMIPIII